MTIAENFKSLDLEITEIARNNGRNPEDVNLIAVSKRQTQDKLRAALDYGHRIFGENRVQEAQEHWAELKADYPDLELHLIGPLQTNKIKDAIALFDVIHTIDREKLARKLGEELKIQNKSMPCLIQVNTGEEPQKAGIPPKDLPDFLHFCRVECLLDIRGLMCIPPIDDPAAVHFAFLKKLASEHDLAQLSMGMSSDYPKAIALGATYIRIGTALFGERDI
ncbi:MAG: YggS family pyridoxal phosphate-dependent enzyme [Alphaproteobacteria bacterium]|nr:YggS family pyridoxal phosphate-dependent enzyme [Alphaproteobacteria bacterium]